jgi:hypothetical protein
MPFAALGALTRGHPFDAIYNHGLRHIVRTRRLPPYRAPRRFACAVATAWLGAAGWAFFAGFRKAGYTLGGSLVLAALVPTLTNFCIPSFFYGLLFGRPASCVARADAAAMAAGVRSGAPDQPDKAVARGSSSTRSLDAG